MIIFRLSPRLGGRSEVLKAKLIELLKYMEFEKEEEEAKIQKEKMDRWFNFMSMLHAHPMSDKQARKKYMDLIDPKIENSTPNINKTYETDIELLKRMKALQKGG